MTDKKNIKDMVIYLVLIIVGVALFVSAQTIEVGATMGKGGDFMPKLCTTVWLILSVLLFFSELKKTEKSETINQMSGLLISLALLFVYIFFLDILGFVIMSMLYLFAQMFLFLPKSQRNKKQYITLALIAVISPIAVNWLFVNVFSLILPTGIL